MKGFLVYPVLLTFLFGTPTFADYADGKSAYDEGDYATALKEFKPLAEQGDAEAQFNLGRMYGEGKGVIQSYKNAFEWYELAAEQGHVGGQYMLGDFYINGKGVIKNPTRSHMWWNIAASLTSGPDYGDLLRIERDELAKTMSPSQIAEAQKLARECVAKNYKDC